MKNFLKKVKNRLKFNYNCYELKKYIKNRKYRTSISDDNIYPALCQAASENPILFSKFRRNSIYNKILEHVTKEQGQEYLTVILQNRESEFSEAEWKDFKKNDLYGGPQLFVYEMGGGELKVSPTTLRYVKVLQDIMTLFDVEKIRRIVEIGVGYGGQCRILVKYLKNVEKYYLFDLPEVLQLSRTWLKKTFSEEKEYAKKVEFIDGTGVDIDRRCDFVISNYAFSELTREVQDIYLDRVILKSQSGYITWNSLSYDMMDGYALNELLEKIPNSFTIPEEPLTSPNNCIIVWGTKKDIL